MNNIYVDNSKILILSYNEGNAQFKDNDCIELINIIKKNKPVIIVLCTQESSSNSSSNFQHIFTHNEYITKEYNYEKIKGYKILGSIVSLGNNRNVRTRIFYDKFINHTPNISMKLGSTFGNKSTVFTPMEI